MCERIFGQDLAGVYSYSFWALWAAGLCMVLRVYI